MGRLSTTEKAMLRRAIEEETATLKKDGQNTSNEFRSEYPRMMYRKTGEKVENIVSTDRSGLPRETTVINQFGMIGGPSLLCETIVAEDIDQAEALAAEGWDITPQAAYGVVTGIVAQTSAKDDEIAALRAQIASMQADAPRRGRPPRQHDEPPLVE